MGEIPDSFQVIKTLFRATKIVQQVKAASLPPSLTSLSLILGTHKVEGKTPP